MATIYPLTQGTYILPKLKTSPFTCPLCHTLCPHFWHDFYDSTSKKILVNRHEVRASKCHNCWNSCLWFGEEMIYPDTSNAPLPNGDLSPEVRQIYQEAVSVMQKSPRAAAALLRLAIETLCIEQGGKGKNLHDQINSLAQKDTNLQKVVTALNVVRLVGNAGAHAGTIQINDNPDIIAGMFKLINYAAERLITAPKELESIIDDVNKLREESKNQESE